MDWLTNWDDLVHGTAVFSAAVPFVIGLVTAWYRPPETWWAGAAGALAVSCFWFFRTPRIPPSSSDDVALLGLGLAVVTLAVARGRHWMVGPALGTGAFAALAWLVYPAWLADGGGLPRQLLVSGCLAASVAAGALLAEVAHRRPTAKEGGTPGAPGLPLLALIPPIIALAVLLQLGGSTRFGQATGALAAALGGVALVHLLRRPDAIAPLLPALGGGLFMLFAWCGWLFAEIRYGLAAALLLAPAAGALVTRLPLPGPQAVGGHLWGGLASALVSAAVAAIAISRYLAEMAEFEGY